MTVRLPFSGREVTYRPYTTKEEKIMMMAMVTRDEQDMRAAVTQVVENCCNIKVAEIAEVDFEFLYLKLIAVSDSAVSRIVITHNCTTEQCPTEHDAVANLEKVEITSLDLLNDAGFIRKKAGWIIPFKSKENMGICVEPISSTFTDTDDEYLYKITKYVYDGDAIYDSFSKEEFIEWIEKLRLEDYEQIATFIGLLPATKLNVTTKCKHCGAEIKKTVTGVLNFLQ